MQTLFQVSLTTVVPTLNNYMSHASIPPVLQEHPRCRASKPFLRPSKSEVHSLTDKYYPKRNICNISLLFLESDHGTTKRMSSPEQS